MQQMAVNGKNKNIINAIIIGIIIIAIKRY